MGSCYFLLLLVQLIMLLLLPFIVTLKVFEFVNESLLRSWLRSCNNFAESGEEGG